MQREQVERGERTAQTRVGGRFVTVGRGRWVGRDVEVFAGIDRLLDRPVVVRRAPVAAVPRDVRRHVEDEAARLGGLSEPALAPALWAGVDRDWFYCVSVDAPGRTLRARLDEGPLSPEEALAVFESVLTALVAIHARGVLHGAIEPSHIIVPEGRVDRAVLAGFGLRECVDAAVRDRPLERLRYVAPERAGLLSAGPDARSDLYSAGITLFECLTGAPPFRAERLDALLREHLVTPLPALELAAPGTPRALADLGAHLSAKDPEDRYQSADAARADLRAIARGAVPVIGRCDRRRTLTRAAFVGRVEELAALEERLEAAREGRGGMVVVAGPSGRGKSALLDELARRARTAGARVLRGAGATAHAARPFEVFSRVAAGVTEAARREPALSARLRAELGERLSLAASILPELSELAPPLGPGGPEATGEHRSVHALAALLDALGEPGRPARPALILLDDLQWADEATSMVLEVLRRSGDGPAHALVVCAVRTGEPEGERTLAALRGLGLDELRLGRLRDEELRALATSMAGRLPDEALDSVVRASNGSPFLAAAALRGLLERGALVWREEGWAIQRDALAELQASREAGRLLARRIERLPESTRHVLSAGALLGRSFEAGDAGALVGAPPDVVRAAVDDARRRELLWVDGRPRFAHDSVRESLLAELDDDERRALHRRAAGRLEDDPEGREFELAYHFDAAGAHARAFPYALRAAEQARSRSALEIAERYYRIAVRGAADADLETRRRVVQGLGEVLMFRGAYAEARDTLERASAMASDDLSRAAIDGELGEVATKIGDAQAAADAVERGLRRLGHRVPPGRARRLLALFAQLVVQALHTLLPRAFVGRRAPDRRARLVVHLYGRLAYAYFWQRGVTQGGLWAHLCMLNLAERHPPSPELAQAYASHAVAMSVSGWFSRGVKYVERSLAMRREAGDRWGEGQSHHFYAVLLYAAGRFEEARAHALEGAALLDRAGDVWERDSARWHAALCSMHRGRLRECVDEAERLLEDARRVGDLTRIDDCLETIARATGGRVPAEAVHAQLGDPRTSAAARRSLLQAEAARLGREGKLDEAIDALEQAAQIVRATSLHIVYSAPVPILLARLARERAEQVPLVAAARRRALLRRALAAARWACRSTRFFPAELPGALRERALVWASLGHPRRAHRDLQRSIALADRQGARWEAALAQRDCARLDDALGLPVSDAARATAERRVQAIEDEVTPPAPPSIVLSHAARFETLLDAGRRIASSLNAGAVLESIEEAALMLFRAEYCKAVLRGASNEPDREILSRVMRARGPVVFDEEEGRRLVSAPSLLGVPIVVRGRVAGCFYVSHTRVAGLFGEDEVRLGRYLATLAGAALENARGFARLEAIASERERLRHEAEAGVRARNDFISIAAHELRTPLTPIRLHAQSLLLQPDLPPAVTDHLATIDRQVSRIVSLVDRLLDVSSIMSRGVVLRREPVELGALVQRVARARDLERARLEIAVRDSITGAWDRERLEQVVTHLLSNAAKFGAGEPIEVVVERAGQRARFSVRDHGVGIAPEHQARILQPFERAVAVRHFGGFGLGLWVVRVLVEAHGGEITVESQPGEGARFTVELPIDTEAR